MDAFGQEICVCHSPKMRYQVSRLGVPAANGWASNIIKGLNSRNI